MDEKELDVYLDLIEFGINREMFDHPEYQDVTFEDEQEWELMDELA